jgi:hypothetical protein
MLIVLLLGAVVVHSAPGCARLVQPVARTEPTIGGHGISSPSERRGFDASVLGTSRIQVQGLWAQGYTITMEHAEAFAEASSNEGKYGYYICLLILLPSLDCPDTSHICFFGHGSTC